MLTVHEDSCDNSCSQQQNLNNSRIQLLHILQAFTLHLKTHNHRTDNHHIGPLIHLPGLVLQGKIYKEQKSLKYYNIYRIFKQYLNCKVL